MGRVELVSVVPDLESAGESMVRQVSSGSARKEAEVSSVIQRLVDESDLESSEEKERTAKLLRDYRDRFPTDGSLGRSGLVKHEIRTGNAPPRSVQPTRVDHSMREKLDGMVNDMLKRKVIRPSVSPYAARVVPVQKKDGSIRFCIDYRGLNADTTKDAFPLPRIDDCLDALSGAQWFHVMDLKSGYWQQELREEDRHKTAFTTHKGLFEFNVTSMGLKGAPASFQRLMMVALSGLVWDICLVYLDDIIVFGRSFSESLERLELVLKALRTANLTVHPGKCSLFRKKVKFLGHVVSKEGVAPDPSKVSAVKHFPVPTSVRGLREFLGLASYFRRFIPKFADVARPLHRLLESSSKFQWSEECEAAFLGLKERLISAPVLRYPDFQKPFTLTTDASDVGLGAVLTQQENGKEHVVAYASRSLTKVEKRYSVTERECLALVWATRRFRVYLQGRHFLLRTDHNPLVHLRQSKDPRGKLARWILELEALDYELKYQPGVSLPHADALSRRPVNEDTTEECCEDGEKAEVRATTLGNDYRVRQAQHDDEDLKEVINLIRNRLPCQSSASPVVKHYMSQKDRLRVDDEGLLTCVYVRHGQEHRQVVVPKSQVEEILTLCHDDPASGHLGVTKTLEKLRSRFYWSSMFRDVKAWVATCKPCARRKRLPVPGRAPFGEMPMPDRPWQWVAMDIAGPFPRTDRGSRYILVVTCGFSKWTEAFALPDQSAATVARVLVEELICRHGCPATIHSDQGRNFEAAVIQEICRILNIKKTRTSPYHAQGNGQTERFNHTLCTMLSMYVSEDQRDWDSHLPFVMFAYRTSMNETTKESPFYLFYGRHARLPAQVMHGDSSPIGGTSDYVRDMTRSLTQAQRRVQDNIIREARRRRERQAAEVRQYSYRVGDRVWLYKPVRKVGRSPKLQPTWCGPYEVVTVLREGGTYRIRLTGKRKSRMVVHHDRLKLCQLREDGPTAREEHGLIAIGSDETAVEQTQNDHRSPEEEESDRVSEFVRDDEEVDDDAGNTRNVEAGEGGPQNAATDAPADDTGRTNVEAGTAAVQELRRSGRERRAPVRLNL